MSSMKRLTTIALTLLAALAVAFAAAAFGAGITVYKSGFDSKGQYEALKKLQGPRKQCKRDWRDKSAFGVGTKGGPVACAVSTSLRRRRPARPPRRVEVIAKVNKDTDDKVRRRCTPAPSSVRTARRTTSCASTRRLAASSC